MSNAGRPREALTRVQLDFGVEQMALLDALQERMGASSRAEVVRRALKLAYLVECGELAVVGPDGVRRRTLLI
jgi:metal-responsive CopG/Arc/MetJ family transcriptional regulator